MGPNASRVPDGALGGWAPLLLLAILVALCPGGVSAQASPTLPLDHPAYTVLDHLAAAGVLPPTARGERVRTRSGVAHLLVAGGRTADRFEAAGADPSLPDGEREEFQARAVALRDLLSIGSRGLESEVAHAGGSTTAPVPTRRILDSAEMVFTGLRSPFRGVPDNGLGTIEAPINPLAAGDQGLYPGDGATLRLITSHSWGGGPLALLFRPSVTLDRLTGESVAGRMGVEQASLRLRVGNAELTAGREPLVRQQSMRKGLVLSSGPRAWDMVQVGTAEPVLLPSLLRLVGPTAFAFFWAHLGADQTFPGGWMLGYRGSIRPHPRLELGGTALFQQGGEGGPEASWGERLLDVLLLPDLLDAEDDYLFSNKLVGADLRLRLPWGRGVEVLLEAALDDFDIRRLRSSFMDNGGFVAGVLLPSVDAHGRASVAAELHRTGATLYRHGQYRTGFTLEGRPVGSALGPDGTGGYLRVTWFPPALGIVTLDAAVEEYRADRYQAFPEPDFRYERVETLPRERRVRGEVSMEWSPGEGPSDFLFRVGGERVLNSSFEAGEERTNLLAEFGVRYRP